MRVERVREDGEHAAERLRRGVDEGGVRRVREHVLRALEPGCPGQRGTARDRLDGRRAERDRLAVRAGVRAPVEDEARARTGADDDEEERRDADARAEARLRERRRPQVGLDDDARRRDRRRRVEVAPVDRVGARRAAREIDELAQPDPDGQPASAELGREGGAVVEHRRSAALGAGRQQAPLVNRARVDVDDPRGDLRPADVDPEGDGHLPASAPARSPRFRSGADIAL